jgi:hypothetical protein
VSNEIEGTFMSGDTRDDLPAEGKLTVEMIVGEIERQIKIEQANSCDESNAISLQASGAWDALLSLKCWILEKSGDGNR